MSTVNNMQIQDDEGNVFHPETSIEQIVGENGTQVFPGGKPGNMESSDMTAAFDEVKMRENIKSGEKHRVLFGKIQKFFADLKTVAFSGKYGDLSERPTLGGAAGYKVADNDTTNNSEFLTTARVAYEHGQEIDALSRDLHALNDSGAIKGMDAREDGVYITYSTGADTVTKKLGDIITREVTGHCGNFHPNYPERSILIDIPAISGYEYFDCAIKECYFENSNGAQKSIRFKIEKYGASKIRVFPGNDSVWTSGGVSATATVMIFYK